jgi:cytochrome o ubiquinol oxidase operon protein cyoD
MTTQQQKGARGDENDVAPGMPVVEKGGARVAVWSYVIGLVLSIVLTAASFYLLHTHVVWRPAIPMAMIALAIAQIGVHLVFFLHITTAPDNTNNVLALAFGVLVVALVVAGSIWIMGHLNSNMMPMNVPGLQAR